MSPTPFITAALFIDVELDARGRIREVAAVRGDLPPVRWSGRPRPHDLAALHALTEGASALVGHNLLAHDLPHLRGQFPALALHRLPPLDTLVLSPLVWPGRPFHRLVKPYKTVLSVENDPVADCLGSRQVLVDATVALQDADSPLLPLVRRAVGALAGAAGFAHYFASLRIPERDLVTCVQQAARVLAGSACVRGMQDVVATHIMGRRELLPLAFALRWIEAAGDGSAHDAVLPTWVRHTWPTTVDLLDQLRGRACGRADCTWCAQAHNPEVLLQRHWGYPGFRSTPTTPEGDSLQRAVVAAGLRGEPSFAAMPTGGGKSIGFQLPALARFAARGSLTVVVSPLQSLMQDQVQSLRARTHAESAAALHGMLTPIERSDVLERVRDGRVGLLYLSPEQMRNRSVQNVLAVREVGAWVFDEAHCLSTWGHDFRTDYRYVLRFVAELSKRQQVEVPPVFCTTATAQLAVVDEICALVCQHTGQTLTRLISSTDRDNLVFAVRAEPPQRRMQAIVDALAERLGPPPGDGGSGSAIVFVRTRKSAELMADLLAGNGWAAAAFHAGLDPTVKRQCQDQFMRGEVRVMCATSAFGMGIDKDDVRLVIHDFLPGSLESYLQQAGRAGRDRQTAWCLLLYDPVDTEAQFRMAADNELRARDIGALLKVVRRLSDDGKRSPTVVSHGELMRLARARPFDPDNRNATTQVNTAVSWLERAELLKRDENRTRVFQGRLKHRTLAEALQAVRALDLKTAARKRWTVILEALADKDAPRGHDADDLADLAGIVEQHVQPKSGRRDPRFAGLALIRTLHEMVRAGLLTKGVELTAWVTVRVKGNSPLRLDRLIKLETALHDHIAAHSTELDAGQVAHLSLRELNSAMLERGHDFSETGLVQAILRAMAGDGRGLGGSRGSLDVHTAGRSRLRVTLNRRWDQVVSLARKRHEVAKRLLTFFTKRINKTDAKARGRFLVEFSLDELVGFVRDDLSILARLVPGKEHVAVERALLSMHELDVLRLDRGLAIFRPAMTLRFDPRPEQWRYTTEHHATLSDHYRTRTLQIHVMDAWARRACQDIQGAMALARDWFQLDRDAFLHRWMPDHKTDDLERRTTAASHHAIVTSLQNPHQEAIVTWRGSRALLVLAGPGSGKTRVIVHRCAWLVRHERVPMHSVLVLCYNRATALEVRARLRRLIGEDARRIDVFTYHGLALRLVGRTATGGELDFSTLLQDAAEVLSSDSPIADGDHRRERILAGYEHILVDEYQDIDAEQYALVSLVAGRTERSRKGGPALRILAVGDDDQNIYAFRQTSTEYIRRFEADYSAKTRHLLQNYRSTRYILDAAQGLIQHDPERLKAGQRLTIDRDRTDDPPGGRVGQRFVHGGRVRVLTAPDVRSQLLYLQRELRLLTGKDPDATWRDVVVLARTHRVLSWVRQALEAADIPHVPPPPRDGLPGPARLRAVARLLDRLTGHPAALVSPGGLLEEVRAWAPGLARDIVLPELTDLVAQTGGAVQAAGAVLERLWEALAEVKAGAAVGAGVRLSTLHGVKGLEFRHVVLVDGDWAAPAQTEWAAERRLLYVGMTRARDTLTVLRRGDAPCPLLDEVDHPAVVRADLPEDHSGHLPAAVRFHLLGMADLDLDWAGRHAASHAVHGALAATKAGTRVQLVGVDGGVHVLGPGGRTLVRLARSAAETWRPRLPRILDARVYCVVGRSEADSREGYRQRLRTDRWAVPLVEVRWR